MHEIAYYCTNRASTWQIIDSRPESAFLAEGRDPAGNRQGHISGSKNLPFTLLLNPDGTLKSNKEISKILLRFDIDASLFLPPSSLASIQ